MTPEQQVRQLGCSPAEYGNQKKQTRRDEFQLSIFCLIQISPDSSL